MTCHRCHGEAIVTLQVGDESSERLCAECLYRSAEVLLWLDRAANATQH